MSKSGILGDWSSLMATHIINQLEMQKDLGEKIAFLKQELDSLAANVESRVRYECGSSEVSDGFIEREV